MGGRKGVPQRIKRARIFCTMLVCCYNLTLAYGCLKEPFFTNRRMYYIHYTSSFAISCCLDGDKIYYLAFLHFHRRLSLLYFSSSTILSMLTNIIIIFFHTCCNHTNHNPYLRSQQNITKQHKTIPINVVSNTWKFYTMQDVTYNLLATHCVIAKFGGVPFTAKSYKS